jgi:peptidoglycan lytic transglycosylase G
MRNAMLKSIGIILLLAAGFSGGWLWMDLGRTLDTPLDLAGTTLHYTVRPGMTVYRIAHDLAAADILQHPHYLIWMAHWQDKATRIQAGEYAIKPGMTPRMFLAMLVEGRALQYALTLIEGWTFNEVMAAIAAHPKLTHTLTGLKRGEIMQRLGIESDPEGLIFPDTYYFIPGTTDIEILRRAYQRMTKILERAWAARDPELPYKTPYEALTMASLIEKETAVAAERPHIAGVFIRRLQQGMRLQTDPTVIYALGDQFNGDLRHRDLELDHPYNTYRYPGLTPTPIAMPGKAAILAALHPTQDDALYFVSKGDGTHHFSATLEEHNSAIVRYQLSAQAQ